VAELPEFGFPGGHAGHGKLPMWLIVGGIGLVAIVGIKALGLGKGASPTSAPNSTVSDSTGLGAGPAQGTVGGGPSVDPTQVLSDATNVQAMTFAQTTQAMQDAYASSQAEALAQRAQDSAQYIAQYTMFGNELQQERGSYTNLLGASTNAAGAEADTIAKLYATFQAPPPAPVATASSYPTLAQEQTNASGLGIPLYDVQGYVGAHGQLPDNIPDLQAYLNSAGLRNPSTGALK
jgi:hypothetical protein